MVVEISRRSRGAARVVRATRRGRLRVLLRSRLLLLLLMLLLVLVLVVRSLLPVSSLLLLRRGVLRRPVHRATRPMRVVS
jgi:hypothetical protein